MENIFRRFKPPVRLPCSRDRREARSRGGSFTKFHEPGFDYLCMPILYGYVEVLCTFVGIFCFFDGHFCKSGCQGCEFGPRHGHPHDGHPVHHLGYCFFSDIIFPKSRRYRAMPGFSCCCRVWPRACRSSFISRLCRRARCRGWLRLTNSVSSSRFAFRSFS